MKLKHALLTSAMAFAFPAWATSFVLVVPLEKYSLSPIPQISVSITAGHIPMANALEPYTFDFNTLLHIQGDSQLDPNLVSWRADGVPAGMSFQGGLLAGTAPSAGDDLSVSITASYRGVVATQSFNIPVRKSIKAFSSYRAWSDGSFASSCLDYLQPSAADNAGYSGDTGTGLYRLKVGSAVFDAQCDMTTDGGGWTLVFNHNGMMADASYLSPGTSCDARMGTTCFAQGYSLVTFTNAFRIDGAFGQAITGDDKLHVQYSVNSTQAMNGATTYQLLTGQLGDFVLANPPYAWRTLNNGDALLGGDLLSSLTRNYRTVFRDFMASGPQHLISGEPNTTPTWNNSCGAMMLVLGPSCATVSHWPTAIRFWVR